MKKKTMPKYLRWRSQRTGKITTGRNADFGFFDEEPTNEPQEKISPQIIEVVACPFQLDDPDVYRKITKPVKRAKFTCEVSLELLLSATSEEENHKHEVGYDVPVEFHKPGVDPSKYILDFGSLFCGIFYQLTPKVSVKLLDTELIDNQEVKKHIEDIEENAKNLGEVREVEAGKERLAGHEDFFNQMYEYLQLNLVNELKRVTEKLSDEAHILGNRSDQRELSINLMLSDEDKILRKRLLASKGRIPTKQQKDYLSERRVFIEQCVEALRKLALSKKKLNKTQLAETLFRDLNPLQSLRRKFSSLEVSFEEILQEYNEQNSS